MVDSLKGRVAASFVAAALVACAVGCKPAAKTEAVATATPEVKAAADAGPGVAVSLAEAASATQAYVAKCYANIAGLQLKHIQVHVVADPHGEIKFARLPREFGIGWLAACVERSVMTVHLAVDLAGPQTLEYDL